MCVVVSWSHETIVGLNEIGLFYLTFLWADNNQVTSDINVKIPLLIFFPHLLGHFTSRPGQVTPAGPEITSARRVQKAQHVAHITLMIKMSSGVPSPQRQTGVAG